MYDLIYERNGVYIRADSQGLTIKKNGLTIELPQETIKDFINEFELERANVLTELERAESWPSSLN